MCVVKHLQHDDVGPVPASSDREQTLSWRDSEP